MDLVTEFLTTDMTLDEFENAITALIQSQLDTTLDQEILDILGGMLDDLDYFTDAVGQVAAFSAGDMTLEELFDAVGDLSDEILGLIDGIDDDSPFIAILNEILAEVDAFKEAVEDVQGVEDAADAITAEISAFEDFLPTAANTEEVVTSAGALMTGIRELTSTPSGLIAVAEASTSAMADSEFLGDLPDELADMLDDIINDMVINTLLDEMVDMLEAMVGRMTDFPITQSEALEALAYINEAIELLLAKGRPERVPELQAISADITPFL